MITLSIATFMFVLDYTIANVAIPYIAGGLGTGIEQGTYVITFFAVGNGVVLPMSGWLNRKFGMIYTLAAGVFFFTLFSLLCGLASNLFLLVFFRFLQGAAAGPLVPLSQACLSQIYQRKQLNIVMSIYFITVLVAPVFGPIIGGYFCIHSTWRWVFLINVPIGAICCIALFILLKHLNKKEKDQKVDYLSFILLLIGMITLQLMLDKGEEWDWFGSIKIRVCFVGAFLSLAYLAFWSFIAKRPLVDLRLLKNQLFAISCFLVFMMYSLYLGTVVVIPLWLQTYMGYDALWAGIAVAPIGVGALFLAPLVGRLQPKIGTLLPLVVGFFIMAIACFYTHYFYSDIDIKHVMISRLILGMGVGCWVSPILSLPLSCLPKEDVSTGLGIFHFMRGVSGGIGTSVYTTIWTRRTIHQHHNLISNFSEYYPQTREYMEKIERLGLKGKGALQIANDLLDREAAVLALNEVSLIMTWICLSLCLVALCSLDWKLPKQSPVN
jgi:DHA2 family multidrug resistance protein